jgi:hypothetical protein
MLFGWFDAREARNFAVSLTDTLAKDLAASERKRQSAAKRAQMLEKLFVQVRQFKQTHSLNIYKKAKIGTSFKYQLLELGTELTDGVA